MNTGCISPAFLNKRTAHFFSTFYFLFYFTICSGVDLWYCIFSFFCITKKYSTNKMYHIYLTSPLLTDVWVFNFCYLQIMPQWLPLRTHLPYFCQCISGIDPGKRDCWVKGKPAWYCPVVSDRCHIPASDMWECTQCPGNFKVHQGWEPWHLKN